MQPTTALPGNYHANDHSNKMNPIFLNQKETSPIQSPIPNSKYKWKDRY